MKHARIIALILVFCMLAACIGCNKPDDGKGTTGADSTTAAPTTQAPTEAPTTTEAEPATEEPGEPDAETAMENFVKKLQAGNYLIAPEKYVVTNVYSPEHITFINGEKSSSDNYAFMTLNGETFEGIIEGDSITEIAFASNKNAIDTVSYILPNSWITVSEGNMWNLFYNNVDDPLEFTSNDQNVKTTLLGLGGYGEMALDLTEEVHMHLDAEDPATVRFTAHVNQPENKMYHYDDLDLVLQFGAGTPDPRVEKWFRNPVYPVTRTCWSKTDIATLDQVFNRDYGAATVPFPDFASYALIFDDKAYQARSEIYLSDGHATEQDVENYKKTLLENGFTAIEETLDGETVTIYRKLLREQYNAYADLYPYYEDGFVLRGGMYYEDPVYDGLAAINEILLANGFEALEETDNFGEWKATDISRSRTEGWAYFFDYKLYMPMILTYQDLSAAEAYLEAYGRKLQEKGLQHSYAPGSSSREYKSANGFILFRYTIHEEDETVTLEFKNERSLTIEEVRALLTEHGLPEADLHGDIGARDLTRYYYIISGFTGIRLSVYQTFESAQEAEAFLDEYAAVLDEQGYYYTNPQAVASQKAFLFLNEELAKYVAFDYFQTAAGASVNFEFVSIEPEEEDILHSVFRH